MNQSSYFRPIVADYFDSTLIFAGSDTTSSALCRALQSLSEHLEVQEMLRKELQDAGCGSGSLDYTELMELPLLDAVCAETLRL